MSGDPCTLTDSDSFPYASSHSTMQIRAVMRGPLCRAATKGPRVSQISMRIPLNVSKVKPGEDGGCSPSGMFFQKFMLVETARMS